MDSCDASSPDDDIVIARRALAEGDLPHAIHHLAGALAADPTRAEWLALLDEVIAAAPDPVQLAPIEGPEPPFYGTVAVHAYIQAHTGQIGQAVDLVLQVLYHYPHIRYLDWVMGWLERPQAQGQLIMDRLAWILSQFVQQFPALNQPHDGGRALLEQLPAFLQRVHDTQPAHAPFLNISVSLLRRLGLVEEALAYAREAYALEPGFHSAIALALAHRTRNEIEAAVAAYRDALSFDPQDVSCRLDIGDMLWDHGREQEALAAYEEVLGIEPTQPWALASCYFLRWMLQENDDWRDRLLALAEACPDNQRAQQLAEQASPYFGYLPEPCDATTNMLKKMRAEQDSASGSSTELSKLTLSNLEAPSNYLAEPRLFDCALSIIEQHNPDQRQPRKPVDYLLWKYEGVKPRVAVDPPAQDIPPLIAQLASQAYHLPTWMRHAARIGQQLGPERVQDLLAVMVHPPTLPAGAPPWVWVYRVQIATALVIAQLDSGWEGSARRRALVSLIHGPMDWTVDAALVALAGIARDEEEHAEEIAQLFRELRHDLPQNGSVCYYTVLIWCSLLLPGLGYEERAQLRKGWRDWLGSGTDGAESHYKMALIHEKHQELDKAIESLTKALEARSDFPQALMLRGGIYLDRDEPDLAVADFTQTIQLYPDVALGYLSRGEAYLQQDRFEEALADFNEAASLTPDDWRVHHWLGVTHQQMEEHDQAIGYFSEAILLQPDAPLPYQDRGRSHALMDHFEQALADLNQAIGLAPQLGTAYYLRAIVHEQRGETDQAIADYTMLLQMNPRSAKFYNRRAKLHYGQRNFAAAIADHKAALELAPEDSATCNHLAWLLATCPIAELRNGPLAREYATRACEATGWKESYCLDTLASAYAECGQFDEAIRYAEQTLAHASEDLREEYQGRLALFCARQPYRECAE